MTESTKSSWCSFASGNIVHFTVDAYAYKTILMKKSLPVFRWQNNVGLLSNQVKFLINPMITIVEAVESDPAKR